MSEWLFNNNLRVYTDKTTSIDFDDIELMKERFARLIFSTSGFCKETGLKDFVSRIKIDKPFEFVSVRAKSGYCYIGFYSQKENIINTKVPYSLINIVKDRDIEKYVTSLSRAEDYYKKKGELPRIMLDPKLMRLWDNKINYLSKNELFPTKLSEIERVSGENISKLYWDNISTQPYTDATRSFLDALYKEARNHNELSK